MSFRKTIHRNAVTAALMGLVASVLLPSLANANCCCIQEARATVDSLESAPRACCTAHAAAIADSDRSLECSGSTVSPAKHRDCNCAMSCCSAELVAIGSTDQRIDRTQFDLLSVNAVGVDFPSASSVVVPSITFLAESLGAQDRCALLCRWLK